MFLKQIDLTTALRPSYLPDEVLLFVQDNVGLYEGCVLDLRSQVALDKSLTFEPRYQEVQAARPTKWPSLLDLASNLLRRQRQAATALGSARPQGGREI